MSCLHLSKGESMLGLLRHLSKLTLDAGVRNVTTIVSSELAANTARTELKLAKESFAEAFAHANKAFQGLVLEHGSTVASGVVCVIGGTAADQYLHKHFTDQQLFEGGYFLS